MTFKPNFDIEDYQAFLKDEFQAFANHFNQPLYHGFRDPLAFLKNPARRTAMMLLLDKSYSAGLTRHSNSTNVNIPSSIWNINAELSKGVHHKRLTAIFKEAVAMEGVLNEDNLETSVQLVEDFKAVLSAVNGTGKSPRSFAPKFLHFVSRAIPPWDSWARNAMAVVTRGAKSKMDDYGTYAHAFFSLLQYIEPKNNFRCEEVKALDNYLVYWGADIGIE